MEPAREPSSRTAKTLLSAALFCARCMMMGADHPRRFARTDGAYRLDIDHLGLVRRNPGVVRVASGISPAAPPLAIGLEPVAPRWLDPAAELTVDRGPLAELCGQITPWRTSPCVAQRLEPAPACAPPDNSIRNKTMIRWLPRIRVSGGTNEARKEGPLIVGHQVARRIHFRRRNELRSRGRRPMESLLLTRPGRLGRFAPIFGRIATSAFCGPVHDSAERLTRRSPDSGREPRGRR